MARYKGKDRGKPAVEPSAAPDPKRSPRPWVPPRVRGGGILLWLFFISGATGLLYEVLFARLLSLLTGSTVHALTTVLTVFMGGLGLGAFLGGRRAASLADPVRAYGLCELGIASSILVPLLLRLLDPLFRVFYARAATAPLSYALLSFAVCALVLLVPTTLMGATLPILVEGLVRRGYPLSRSAGTLYAVNTFGAFAGALATGFVLLPLLGQVRTLALGAALNVLLFVLVIRSFPKVPTAGTEAPRPRAIVRGDAAVPRPVVATAYAASGFAAMALQIGWTRAAAFSIGSSTYTFSLVVAAFIFGLALGALAISRLAGGVERAPWIFGGVQIGIGVSAALVLPLFGTLPVRAYDLISRHKDSFGGLMAVELAMLFGLCAVPTMLMGALFPLAARSLATDDAGRAVGAAYGANTVGSILGAFVAGFFLLPHAGVRGTLLLASGCNVLFGCLALAFARPVRPVRLVAAAGIALVAFMAGSRLPAWNPTILASGPYLLDPGFKERVAPRSQADGGSGARIVFFRDDPDVTVAVEKLADGHVLRLNGKVDASTFADMPTQQLLGHLPMLLHGHARRACVIGMGSGVSAGAVAIYPDIERVDVVEIARSVIEAARYFDDVNHHVLQSPKVRVVLADGRTHLRFTPETYDVIVSEPSNPWIAGIGKLFTVELFQECRDRLAPGGLMAAWLQTYGVSREAVATVLGSFAKVFPNVTVWTCSPGDLIMVGGKDDPAIDVDGVAALLRDPSLASDMKALWIEEPVDLVAHLLLGPDDVARLACEGRLNTDDNGWLELHAPRSLHDREGVLRAAETFASRASLAHPVLPLRIAGSEAERRRFEDRLGAILGASGSAARAQEAHDARDLAGAERESREALAKNGRDLPAALVLGDVLLSRTRSLVDAGRYEEAVPLLSDLARIIPNDPRLPYDAVLAYVRLNRPADAIPWLDRLVRATPDDLVVRANRALALIEVKRYADARADLDEILRRQPNDVKATFMMGRALLGLGQAQEAEQALDRVLASDPEGVDPRYYRAQAARALGDASGALRDLETIFDRKPEARREAAAILREEGDRLTRLGEKEAAAQAYARALIEDPGR